MSNGDRLDAVLSQLHDSRRQLDSETCTKQQAHIARLALDEATDRLILLAISVQSALSVTLDGVPTPETSPRTD